jgi:hypothetical protein
MEKREIKKEKSLEDATRNIGDKFCLHIYIRLALCD